MTDVRGKVAFITGGGSGVGYGQASVFADAGCRVAIADIRQDHLDEAAGQLAKKGHEVLAVNSAHHQAVDRTGRAVVVSATAPDGVVEAIEHPGYRFCLGIQWHPEFLISEGDLPILRALVGAAGR